MKLADDSKNDQSEDDMGREDNYGDQSQNESEIESGCSEEEDTVDIMPSQAKLFKPSTEQTEMWELLLRRDGQFGHIEWALCMCSLY